MRAYRAILEVHSGRPVYEFTGVHVKTLIYALAKELRIFRGIRGIVSPVHLSPLFRVGKGDMELGDLASPMYRWERERGEWVLKPVELEGEYIFHFGGDDVIASKIASYLEELRSPLAVKIGDSIVTYKLEKLEDVTDSIREKVSVGNRVRVYLKAPAMIFNVFTRSKLPKFSPSAVEVLMVPYMLVIGAQTFSQGILDSSLEILGGLVETWYSLNTLRPVMIPYKGKREVALMGQVTYIVEVSPRHRRRVEDILVVAETSGIGESRQNGFGTVVVQA
ncbi:MAG: CRISPR system precrRNA processing endoribonuclease RAMP protein Cas6 [Desulfurococcales archaeon]|nr:CRISPR system precrRNA processing endoribonuclease RAMP protein Cas6 [Desulfurococcales archaeon]